MRSWGCRNSTARSLAVEEINKKGGILGRQIELIHLDPQGDNARYQEFARRLLGRDKVDVLIGGITSASREAIRPIINRTTYAVFLHEPV